MIEHTCSGSPCGFCSQQEEIGALKAEREALRAEVGRLKRMSTVEMMCENESVRAHVTEWEERCLKAEAEVSRLQAQNVAPLVNKIDELQRENMRLQQIIDGWAGLVAAHQPSPEGAQAQPVATYTVGCPDCKRLREALSQIAQADCPTLEGVLRVAREALSGEDGKTDRRSP
jgi:FtsZ-binding cell division protein ZapB